MTTPDPAPRGTRGVAPRVGVPPGETPPAEGGTSGISYPEPPAPRRGWESIPVVLIMVVAVLIAIGLIGMAVSLMA
ncbi:DUF6480 family protein [Streptomyces sp. NPDC001868]|uniref:DUF6480 family protein n=1 Tax=Streptomyces sp. NPDC001868 TaxID=3154401 RepID=UPI0033253DD1